MRAPRRLVTPRRPSRRKQPMPTQLEALIRRGSAARFSDEYNCKIRRLFPWPEHVDNKRHLTGPFLAADAFAKHLRLRSEVCTVTTFSDVNQSYVRVTAERQRRDPLQLAHQWSEDIRETLSLFHMQADHFLEPNVHSCDFV